MRGELIYLMMHLENGKSKTKTQVSDTKACVFNSLFLCTFINHLKNSINITKQLFQKVLWWMRLSAGKRAKTWARMCACKVAQSCLTLCSPMDYTVHGILQAGILEWGVVPFSRWSSQPRDWTQVSCIAGRFFTSWATREVQEYRVG